jgi:L-ascorbate metabolism protein UlaG (beta-lactamase superfamily)
MKISYLGHSSFLVESKGKKLLFDPMISANPLASSIDPEAIKPDYILLSHGHEDHVADVEMISKSSKAAIISSYEVVTWFQNKGIDGHPMNIGGKWKFDFGYVKYVNAVHSSMLPDRSYGGPSGGFLVWNDEVCFYFAGDTALTYDMKLIPLFCPKLDFAILPVGDNFTMGYEDAVLASEFIGCDTIIGAHYDTFRYIKTDKEKAVLAFAQKGKKLIFPNINENVKLQ